MVRLDCIQSIFAQKARDESVDRLVEIMRDTYAFVHEADSLKKIESQKGVIMLLTQQTIDCGYFIRDYAKNKSFFTLVHVGSDGDTSRLYSSRDENPEEYCVGC